MFTKGKYLYICMYTHMYNYIQSYRKTYTKQTKQQWDKLIKLKKYEKRN